MANLLFNLKIFDLEYRLSKLVAYNETFEEQLTYVTDQTLLRAKAKLSASGVDKNSHEFDQHIEHLEQETKEEFPQLLRSQVLTATWSLIENSVKTGADILAERKSLNLRLSDLRGRSPEDQWKKYFNYVLEAPFDLENKTWKRISDLREIRNFKAHGGFSGQPTAQQEKRFQEIANRNDGVVFFGGDLFFQRAYVDAALDLAESVISNVSALVVSVTGGDAKK
ncbi:hypothetical protein HNO52_18065 [Billgrantia diversa]|uniref:hypothetical protein n=1 Tax=Halomonas sp. MCCC 1A13316 TaxID=2733487 RepID=UPI0018A53F63|nr:hypothetical protein [Halomonas sp. MCCC 1A13316]QOR40211.1 hypothetical protein HNO52_18065 [Halomonas sp. MCCC 1A13316]